MKVLNTILSILLFLIALGILVTIHELGHFIAAKSFNVYCNDFSIGFGPKIIKIKRKKGETTFNVGVLPLGGYVSMYGEGVELPDGVTVPRNRSLEGIARWKRVIIMSAGVIMNFVLAYVIFFISVSCFPQYQIYSNGISLVDQTAFEENKTFVDENGDLFTFNDDSTYIIYSGLFIYDKDGKNNTSFSNVVKAYNHETKEYVDSVFTYHNEETNEDLHYVFKFKSSLDSINGLNNFTNMLELYPATLYENVSYLSTDEDGKTIYKTGSFYLPTVENNTMTAYQFSEDKILDISYPVTLVEMATSTETIEDKATEKTSFVYTNSTMNLTNKNNKNSLDSGGFSTKYWKYWYGWDSFRVAGEYWVDSTTLISQALGKLFIGQGWENMGGPVAIFTQTTQILTNYPFNYYLQTWGVISVNLALFNLLPFPGLDGWQILVTIIEGIVNLIKRIKFKKENDNSSYDNEKLNVIRELDLDLDDIKSRYRNTINKKFNYEELYDKYNQVEVSEDKEFKYFKEYVDKEKEKNNFINENNLADAKVFKEWRIPERIKNIVSYIGLALLFALMIAIFIKDVIGLF